MFFPWKWIFLFSLELRIGKNPMSEWERVKNVENMLKKSPCIIKVFCRKRSLIRIAVRARRDTLQLDSFTFTVVSTRSYKVFRLHIILYCIYFFILLLYETEGRKSPPSPVSVKLFIFYPLPRPLSVIVNPLNIVLVWSTHYLRHIRVHIPRARSARIAVITETL